MSKNVCKCPEPPGGEAVCEPHQLAICRIVDGRVHTQCVNPPASLDGGIFIEAPPVASFDATKPSHLRWALQVIRGEEHGDDQHAVLIEKMFGEKLLLSREERRILAQGEWNDPASGETVTFRLPQVAKNVQSFLHLDSRGGYGEEGT